MKRTKKNQLLYAKLKLDSIKRVLRKIKWKNVALLIVGVISAIVILHDLYMLTIYSWITGITCGWTWIGFITFMLAVFIVGNIYDYFEEFSN